MTLCNVCEPVTFNINTSHSPVNKAFEWAYSIQMMHDGWELTVLVGDPNSYVWNSDHPSRSRSVLV